MLQKFKVVVRELRSEDKTRIEILENKCFMIEKLLSNAQRKSLATIGGPEDVISTLWEVAQSNMDEELLVQMVTDDHCSDSEDVSENVLESY
jgi:hypothetical protein